MIEFTEKQQRLIQDIWDDEHDRIIVVGPVRSGKSLSAVHGFMDWIMSHEGRSEYIISATTAKQLKASILGNVEQYCSMHGISFKRRTPEHYEIDERLILWPLMGPKRGDADKAKSYSVRAALIDEATDQDRDFILAVEDRCSHPDAKVIYVMNPDRPKHWINRELIPQAKTDPKVSHWQFTLRDNPTLTERYMERLKARYTGAQYQRLVLGKWAASSNVVWPDFDRSRTAWPSETEKVQRYWASIRDQSGLTTFALIVGETVSGKRFVIDEWSYDSRELGQITMTEKSAKLIEWLKQYRVSTIVLDRESTVLGRILERKLLGVHVIVTEQEPEDTVKKVDYELGDKLFVSLDCTQLIEASSEYEWREWDLMNGKDVPDSGEGLHACEALANLIGEMRETGTVLVA